MAKSPTREEPAPDYENGWNSINQYIREEYSWNGREPNLLYVRRGGRFRDCSGVSGLDFASDTRTFAATDFDGDGNLDLFVKSRLGPQVRAMRNCCGVARNSIAFTLRGSKSNRDAIGAVVEVECGARRLRRALQAGSGYLSQHTKRLLFGLDRERTATRVKISWPSGLEQVFENLSAGHVYAITEGSPDVKRTAFQPRRPIRTAPVTGDDSVRMEPTWLFEPVPLPDRRKGPGFLLLTGGSDSGLSGVPVEVVNLARAAPEIAACYSLFRRYVFDWRAPLTLPLTILVDSEGRAGRSTRAFLRRLSCEQTWPPRISASAPRSPCRSPAGITRTRLATITSLERRSLERDTRSRRCPTLRQRSGSGRIIFKLAGAWPGLSGIQPPARGAPEPRDGASTECEIAASLE